MGPMGRRWLILLQDDIFCVVLVVLAPTLIYFCEANAVFVRKLNFCSDLEEFCLGSLHFWKCFWWSLPFQQSGISCFCPKSGNWAGLVLVFSLGLEGLPLSSWGLGAFFSKGLEGF